MREGGRSRPPNSLRISVLLLKDLKVQLGKLLDLEHSKISISVALVSDTHQTCGKDFQIAYGRVMGEKYQRGRGSKINYLVCM